jgi:hypothetical protein
VSETRECCVRQKDGARTKLSIEVSQRPPWALVVAGAGWERRSFVGDDLFEAMNSLRREIELGGGRLICAGARIDTFPSGMARSMGSARKVYKTQLGHPATELMDIFDETDELSVGTVAQQLDFHRRWIDSLRHRK